MPLIHSMLRIIDAAPHHYMCPLSIHRKTPVKEFICKCWKAEIDKLLGAHFH